MSHVRVDGWPGQRFALVFRDWLAAGSAARAEYLAVKGLRRRRRRRHGPGDGRLTYAAATRRGSIRLPRALREWARSGRVDRG